MFLFSHVREVGGLYLDLFKRRCQQLKPVNDCNLCQSLLFTCDIILSESCER